MKYKTLLFDLDGTLTDSGDGIMNSVEYALDKMGFPKPERSQLRSFIGPPLAAQFSNFCHISEAEGHKAVEIYREYYHVKGLFENSVYDGMMDTLEALKQKGYQLCIATSKPEKFAVQIAEHFHFAEYFDVIAGSMMDGSRVHKAEVIEYVLQQCDITDRSRVLMIGDRNYDILGAKQAGLDSMGVLFGYGSREELESAGADYIVEKAVDIPAAIE